MLDDRRRPWDVLAAGPDDGDKRLRREVRWRLCPPQAVFDRSTWAIVDDRIRTTETRGRIVNEQPQRLLEEPGQHHVVGGGEVDILALHRLQTAVRREHKSTVPVISKKPHH